MEFPPSFERCLNVTDFEPFIEALPYGEGLQTENWAFPKASQIRSAVSLWKRFDLSDEQAVIAFLEYLRDLLEACHIVSFPSFYRLYLAVFFYK